MQQNRLTIEDLSQIIAPLVDVPEVLENDRGVTGAGNIQLDEVFVSPPLTLESGEVESAQVVLVRAPAAVGKTTCARRLASASGAPYWDLAGRQVAENYFSGGLRYAFGVGNLGAALSWISAGGIPLIIDALDEARLNSGDLAWEAALLDLIDLIQDVDGPALALFGRPEAVDLASVVFEAAGVGYCTVSIGFFDRVEAEALVNDTARHLLGRELRHPSPFGDFRDAVFSEIFSMLGATESPWEDTRAREFVGYAPVLRAITAFLIGSEEDSSSASMNYDDMRRQLEEAAGASALWSLLEEIVFLILNREETKLRANLRSEFVYMPDDSDVSYSASEQCLLLAQTPEPGIDLRAPEWVRPEDAQRWVQRVRLFFADHPFLREELGSSTAADPNARFANQLFRDFVYAQIIVTGDEAIAAPIIAATKGAAYVATPMLSRFVLAQPEGTEEERLALTSDRFEAVAASLFADAPQSQTVHVVIGEPYAAPYDTGSISDSVLQLDSYPAYQGAPMAGEPLFEPLFIRVVGSLRLGSSISHVDVTCTDLVELGSGHEGPALVFGPDVRIEADVIVVEPREIRVRRQAQDYGVELTANEFETRGLTEPQVHNRDDLRIFSTAPLAFPLDRFEVHPPTSNSWTSVEAAALDDLRRLFKRFVRSSLVGGFLQPEDAIRTAIRKGRIPEAALEFCLLEGVVTREGRALRPRLDEHGIRMDDLIYQPETAELRDLVTKYLLHK